MRSVCRLLPPALLLLLLQSAALAQPEGLPPGGVGRPGCQERLVPLAYEPDVIRAVVLEVDVHGGASDLTVVEPNQRAGRLG